QATDAAGDQIRQLLGDQRFTGDAEIADQHQQEADADEDPTPHRAGRPPDPLPEKRRVWKFGRPRLRFRLRGDRRKVGRRISGGHCRSYETCRARGTSRRELRQTPANAIAHARYSSSNRWLMVAPMRSASSWSRRPPPRRPSTLGVAARRFVVVLLKLPPPVGAAPVSNR